MPERSAWQGSRLVLQPRVLVSHCCWTRSRAAEGGEALEAQRLVSVSAPPCWGEAGGGWGAGRTFLCVHIHTQTHMQTHAHIHAHVCAHTCTHACITCVHTCTHTHAHTYTCAYKHTNIYAHAHTTHIHTHMHTHHSHTHTHTYPARSNCGLASSLPHPSQDQCSPHPAHFEGRLLPKRLHPTSLAFQACQRAVPCAITAKEGLHAASTACTPIGASVSSPDTGLVGGVLGSVPSDAGRRAPFSGGSRGSVAPLPSRGWGGAPGVRDVRAPSLAFQGGCSAVRPRATSRPGALGPLQLPFPAWRSLCAGG